MRYTVEPDEDGQGWWVEDAKGNGVKYYDRADHAQRLAATLNDIDKEISPPPAPVESIADKAPPAPKNWDQMWQGAGWADPPSKIQGALPSGEDD
jgi:hypothetical protein